MVNHYLLDNEMFYIKPKQRIIAILIAVFAVLSFVGWQLFLTQQIYNFTKVGADLSTPLPKKIKPVKEFKGINLTLGYADVLLPMKRVDEVHVVGKGAGIMVGFDKIKFGGLCPFQGDPAVLDHYFLDAKGSMLVDAGKIMKKLEEIKNEPNGNKLMMNLFGDYRWRMYCLNAKPKSFTEILLSSSNVRALYVIRIMLVVNRFSQRGVLQLETEHINAIIYLGDEKSPNLVVAEVFSKNGKISQSINVSSDSWALSEKVMLRILSKFKYSVDTVPAREEVTKLVLSTMKQHEKYTPNNE